MHYFSYFLVLCTKILKYRRILIWQVMYLRFILKTQKGYLTQTGTTEDICDKNIIVLNIYGIGGFFSSKKVMFKIS